MLLSDHDSAVDPEGQDVWIFSTSASLVLLREYLDIFSLIMYYFLERDY